MIRPKKVFIIFAVIFDRDRRVRVIDAELVNERGLFFRIQKFRVVNVRENRFLATLIRPLSFDGF